MPNYSDVIGRDDAEALVPVEFATEVIKEAPKESAVLSLAKRVPMSSKTKSQPVLSVLPQAYWVNGDAGLKQTTEQQWKNQVITAEELAAIVVIPDALFDDSSIPLWDEVKPYLVEALGRTLDAAAIFGTDKPASWTTPAIVPGAIAAGNTVTAGTGADIGVDVAEIGRLVAEDGYSVTGFASGPGLQWALRGVRSVDGVPIYGALDNTGTSGLYGFPLNEVNNGAWDSDSATLIAADWSKFVVGVRQDITFKVFEEGVISDADGKVIVNLMQQDSKALRVVFRVGFVGANPITAVNATDATRFPAGVLVPSAVVPPVTPTGVTAGTPGEFSPVGAEVPATIGALRALGALGQTTAWSTGEYVVIGSGNVHWNGTDWATGVAS